MKLLEFILCRTTAFDPNDDLEVKWQELKSMIAEASSSFYQIIEHLNPATLKSADEKVKYSIWKYFNRAKFRATPFGSFAAFTLLGLSEEEELPLILNHKIISNRFIDWNTKDACTTSNNTLVKKSTFFQTNSSLYAAGAENRYIRLRNGIFEVASVIGFPELNAMLDLCRNKISKKEIFLFMESKFKMSPPEIHNLLKQMLPLQLLTTEQFPNIIGEDYFERVKVKKLAPTGNYIISERKVISGGVDSRKLDGIPDAIKFLSKYLPDETNEKLNTFRRVFLKRFEQKMVPLAIAMDLETGVGYGDLGHDQTGDDFINMLCSANQNEGGDLQITYTELHCFLLNSLMKEDIVRLEEFEDKKPEASLPLPNTFSVMLHFWNDHPVIENAGGCTANALLGRFTIASTELEKFSRQIAASEEKANPHILFFDVGYQAEKQVDNINRRKEIYKHELPILTWSCNASAIDFDDILVGVFDSEVVLWSKKYNKRMIPRIPSAYNYTRSDLAVYRFLCDLQHQGIKSDLNFRIKHFFPNLNYYPRVVYKDVIVSPAMWLIPNKLYRADKTNNLEIKKERLINWLHNKGIDFLFKAGHNDQLLCFDPKIENDMSAFWQYCIQNNQKDIYISESLIADKDKVIDENGKQYIAEFILSYCHEHPVYKRHDLFNNLKKTGHYANDIVFPGGEWLCFEIYCHPLRSNDILITEIASFIKYTKQHIQKWFFIRYNDPKPHIRLRLHLKDASFGYRAISKLKFLLNQKCQAGLISDIQIKTYFRETERYGPERINQAEDFFSIDSSYVLLILAKAKTINQLYATTLAIMAKLIATYLNDINDQVLFVNEMANNFSREFAMSSAIFKKLNISFKEFKENINSDIISTYVKLSALYAESFKKTIGNCINDSERSKMVADLLHMHVNRMFHSDQRGHEAILYHYLLKLLKTRQAISTLKVEC